MSSPNKEYKELANNAEAYIYSDAFKELIKALGYKHPNGFEHFSFAQEHAFTDNWDYKLKPIDETIFNTIDGVGVVLGVFGLDVFSDVAGLAYSSFRGDKVNVAAYSASVLFIGPEGLVVKKGISSSKNLILRTAKGEIIEVDDLVKSTKHLDGIVSSDISIEELRSLQEILNSCHPKLSEDMESLFALHSILSNKEAPKLGMTIDFFTRLSGTKEFPYKEMLQTLNSFAKAVESNKLNIDLNSFKRVLADIEKSGSFEVGAEWTLRYISQHGGEFTGKKLNFEVIEEVGDKIRRMDMVTETSVKGVTKKTFYEFKSVKDVPPAHFLEQFGKDLANSEVSGLSQIKWIFDGKKVTQEQLTNAIKKAIDDWNIPDDIKTKWLNPERTEKIFKEELLSIFKVQ